MCSAYLCEARSGWRNERGRGPARAPLGRRRCGRRAVPVTAPVRGSRLREAERAPAAPLRPGACCCCCERGGSGGRAPEREREGGPGAQRPPSGAGRAAGPGRAMEGCARRARTHWGWERGGRGQILTARGGLRALIGQSQKRGAEAPAGPTPASPRARRTAPCEPLPTVGQPRAAAPPPALPRPPRRGPPGAGAQRPGGMLGAAAGSCRARPRQVSLQGGKRPPGPRSAPLRTRGAGPGQRRARGFPGPPRSDSGQGAGVGRSPLEDARPRGSAAPRPRARAPPAAARPVGPRLEAACPPGRVGGLPTAGSLGLRGRGRAGGGAALDSELPAGGL